MPQNNQKNLFYAIAGLVGIIIVFGLWILMPTRKTSLESIVTSNRDKISPLPMIDFDFLQTKELNKKLINGNLPINTGGAGLGKKDPFAG